MRLVFPLTTGRVWGLLPSENAMDAYKSRQFEYWEWWESLLARTVVWAARREGTTAFVVGQDQEEQLSVKADRAPPGARMRVVWRSGREIRFDGPLLRKAPQEIPLDADGQLALPIPSDLPAGPVIADMTLLDGQGRALNWWSVTKSVAQRARIVAVNADREAYVPEAEAKLTIKLSAAQAVETTVDARLIDAFGRVVTAATQPCRLAAGETEQELTLPIRSPLCVHHRAMVRVLCDGREQDSTWVDVLVPCSRSAAGRRGFSRHDLGARHDPSDLLAEFSARTQQLGLNSEFGTNLYAMSEHGLPCAGYIGMSSGAFRCEKHTGNGVRPDCLSDPKVVAGFTKLGPRNGPAAAAARHLRRRHHR